LPKHDAIYSRSYAINKTGKSTRWRRTVKPVRLA
jgi:hypothetical protein